MRNVDKSLNTGTSGVVIAIPTYNESENLQWIVNAVLSTAPQVNVLVVDDNSPDGTGELAEALSAGDSRVHVLHRAEKDGLGPAYIAAFRWAIDSGYTWVGQFDADGSHRAQDLTRLLAVARGTSKVDLVIGSRWCRGGATEGWAWSRQILSRAGSAYVRTVLGLQIKDTTAGFRVYRTDFLQGLLKNHDIESKGYGFQIEMTWRSVQAKASIKEVPIVFVERRAGTSKMSGLIIKEAFIQVLRWRCQGIMGL